MQPTQQDIQTLHGVLMAIAEGRKGPARGGVLESDEAGALRALLAEQARRACRARGPVRGLARLLRRNPTDAERALWDALTKDRRFAGRGFKRQVPVGPHITDFVSFPLRTVIDLVPEEESEAAAKARAEKRGWLAERDYRVVEIRRGDVERDVAARARYASRRRVNRGLAGALAARLDLGDRLLHQLDHRAANLLVGLRHALGVEILANLLEHVVVAGLLEVGHDDFLGVGVAASPVRPSFSAAHSPSSLLRRAFALKRSSSSCANFFSKPSSRLSNVVMVASLLTDVRDRGKSALHIGPGNPQINMAEARHGADVATRACERLCCADSIG